ncbi:MAG: cytochrome c3 family protein [Thermodesulfovibrionales bacterium]
MLFRPLGYLSSRMGKKFVILFLLQVLIVISLAGFHAWSRSSAECVRCHADPQKMRELRHPEFLVTQEMVREQSNHPFVGCVECHLGNGRAKDKDKAHANMLRMLIIGHDGSLLERRESYPYGLDARGNDRISELLPKIDYDGEIVTRPEVMNILWHDRNRDTFNFDPEIARKTCAKSGCHPEQLKQFSTTVMGRNYRQRTMRTWTDPYGPHNCGPSFADLPAGEELEGAGFDFTNTKDIVRNLNVGFTNEQAADKQKLCNICHAGCLDCHFAPSEGKPHRFVKVPSSEGCSGLGRGTNICHPGAMHSRRGETYIGGDYAVPPGMKPDVHFEKDIHCVDCHPTGERGMGDMERKATCQDCHVAVEEAHGHSIHRSLDCATCHISELGGYQITVWGPGSVGMGPNPFKKYSLYYGIQKPPILMKDQKGAWMPVKVWPHSVGNIKDALPASPKVQFRWPEGETRDAYYIVGTADNLPKNNRHLLWIEIEQAAHPFGRSRSCASCHEGPQVSTSSWEFYDYQGAEPFQGSYSITADGEGLRIQNLRNTTPVVPLEGYSLSDFASWLYLKDKWSVPGDFAIPTDKQKYLKYKSLDKKINLTLEGINETLRGKSGKMPRDYLSVRGAALHDPDHAESLIRTYLEKAAPPPGESFSGRSIPMRGLAPAAGSPPD